MTTPRCHFASHPPNCGFATIFRRLAILTLSAFLAAAPASPQTAGKPALQPDRKRARKDFLAGQDAERSGDWKTAYADYTDAVAYDPADKEYPLLWEHARFQVIQGLVNSAERQAIAGDVAGARALLNQALAIDPNFVVARERLNELSSEPVEAAPEPGPKLAGLPRLQTKPGTRDFDFRGTTRSAYEEIGRQFGITIAFDGDLVDRSIRFQAPKVDFDTALMVLSRQTQTFTRVVDRQQYIVRYTGYRPEVSATMPRR